MKILTQCNALEYKAQLSKKLKGTDGMPSVPLA